MIKSFSFYSYKLNQEKFNFIKEYAKVILKYKNIVSEYYYNNYIGIDISMHAFVTASKHLLQNQEIGSSFFQRLQMEVWVRYNTKDIQKKIKKPIEFIKLSFDGINQLSHNKHMIELSDITIGNAIINLNIPHNGIIHIPTNHSRKYHGSLSEYKHGYTKKTDQSQIFYKLTIQNDKIKIAYTKEYDDVKIEHTCNNILGIDVNSKNNIFALSDGTIMDYDRKLVKKLSKHKIKNKRIEATKANRKLPTDYSKKQEKIANKNIRRCKWHAELKASELLKYCNINNVDHIVLEDLASSSGKNYCKTKENINYNDLFKLLRLYGIKKIIERMSNHYGITVSLTNPAYTSQQCSKCGISIHRKNRTTQEEFKCIECGHTENADINAAKNIRDRIYVNVLRGLLHVEKESNKYIPKIMTRKELKETLLKVYGSLN